jgi:hypothetical protein
MENQFFDINKFPKDWGVIVFPVSMTRIANAISPQACIDALDFLRDKIQVNQVGAHFLYSEGLYMNFATDAYETKNSFAQTAVSHMRGVRNLVEKHYMKFQIDAAFSFESWFQMYLSHKDFFNAFKAVKDLYASDTDFQKYIAEDAATQGKELTERQVAFFLEEHTFSYLLMNGQLQLRNDFVNGREKWILTVYPGKPPKSLIYLCQKDILKLMDESSNPYKGQYDLDAKKFIDFKKVDLENFSY